MPHQAYVTLRIFTILGMEVATLVSESLGSGDYTVDWNAKAFPSGMYFYRMQAGAFSKSKKLVLLK